MENEKKKVITNTYEFRDEKGNVIGVHKNETTEEIEELRKLRNECNSKASEYQKRIDALFLEMHETPDIIGKFVCINTRYGMYEHIYGKVSEIHRIKDGINVALEKPFCENIMKLGIAYYIGTCGVSDRVFVAWDDIKTSIKEITREEFSEKIKGVFDIYLKDF